MLQGSEYSLEDQEAAQPHRVRRGQFQRALHSIAATGTFEEAIIEAANLGGDADTIAAITGGLAGAIYGYKRDPGEMDTDTGPENQEAARQARGRSSKEQGGQITWQDTEDR